MLRLLQTWCGSEGNHAAAKPTFVHQVELQADKRREAQAGCDGTWVAHPDLIGVAQAEFDAVLGDAPHQKDKLREDVRADAAALTNPDVPGGSVSEAGVRENISVTLQYLSAWLSGTGAAAINNLMEDAATAEISRAQLWGWLRHGARLDTGEVFTEAHYQKLRDDELGALRREHPDTPQLGRATELLDDLVLGETFAPFLTLEAYRLLD